MTELFFDILNDKIQQDVICLKEFIITWQYNAMVNRSW